MTNEEYWYAPPRLAVAYREANKLRMRRANEDAWLQGLYIREAIREVAAGFDSSNRKKPQYPKDPIDLGLETEAEKKDKAKREREKIIASLSLWKKAWDAQKSGETP